MNCKTLLYLLKGRTQSGLLFNRGHPFVGKSAGVDVGKIAQISGDIQRETVHSHKMRSFHTNGANLAGAGRVRIKPNSGSPFESIGRNPIFGHGTNNTLFDRPYIISQAYSDMLQIENRIAHKLTQTVLGDITAPIRMKIGSTDLLQKLFIDQQIRFVAAFA